VFGLSLGAGVLLAEKPASAPPEMASPLAAALGVTFVEGSSSSLILERDGKQYVVDLAAKTIRENDVLQVASADSSSVEPPQTPAQALGSSGAAIFRQQCATCHGPDGKGTGGSTPDLTDSRRSSIPSQRIIDIVTNGKPGTGMQGFS